MFIVIQRRLSVCVPGVDVPVRSICQWLKAQQTTAYSPGSSITSHPTNFFTARLLCANRRPSTSLFPLPNEARKTIMHRSNRWLSAVSERLVDWERFYFCCCCCFYDSYFMSLLILMWFTCCPPGRGRTPARFSPGLWARLRSPVYSPGTGSSPADAPPANQHESCRYPPSQSTYTQHSPTVFWLFNCIYS